jgi:histo-blood group ABO system transferase
MNIGLIIIATGKYDRFIDPLLQSARIHFLPEDSVTFFLFTDSIKEYGEDVVVIPTKHKPWPSPTLHRYRNIVAAKDKFEGMDYLFYSDVDMLFVDTVGREILSKGLTVTHHPGFYSFGTGSWCNIPASCAYTTNRKAYYAGGFNGGTKDAFLFAADVMDYAIQLDEDKGVQAEWQDESHLNKLISMEEDFKALTPSYCYPDNPELARLWKIDHLKPKLLALSKNHQEVRS